MLDEIAGQRYFRAKLQEEIDLAEEMENYPQETYD